MLRACGGPPSLGAWRPAPTERGSQATLGPDAPSAESRALLIGPAALALMLALPWLSSRDPDGLVFRLRIMAFVTLAVCAPAAIAQLIATARPRVRQLLLIAAAAAAADRVAGPRRIRRAAVRRRAASSTPRSREGEVDDPLRRADLAGADTGRVTPGSRAARALGTPALNLESAFEASNVEPQPRVAFV